MEIEQIREQIDAVDGQMLKLFLERMRLGEEVAAYKKAHNLPVLNKAREREILARVQAEAGDMEPAGRRCSRSHVHSAKPTFVRRSPMQ